MENLKLLSGRLQWCIDRKLERDPGFGRVTKTQIADVAGRSRAAVTYWFQDVNGLDADAARKLGDFFRVNPVWLETGEGSPEVVKEESETGRVGLTPVESDRDTSLRRALDVLAVFTQANERERRIIEGAVADVRELMSQRAAVKHA